MTDKTDPFYNENIDIVDLIESGGFELADNQAKMIKEMEQTARNTLEQRLTPLELAKHDLAKLITKVIKNRKLTQTQAGKLLGTKQPIISHLKRGKIDGVTFDWLITALMTLDRNISIGVKKHGPDIDSSIYVQAA